MAEERLSRRLLVLRLGALGGTAATTAACVPNQPMPVTYVPVAPPAYARGTGITDSDPSDGPGQGRGGFRSGTGYTDRDPSDGPGRGRGPYGRPVQGVTGVTDRDPSDGPGRGRGWGGGGYRTGLTDSDPRDGVGQGRGGGYRTGRTDSDPRDAPGRGRW
ncbi:MAG: hypothetical protein K2X11_18525 [Acetobacteraceae bacterium]|nr:hypothetical protein [Acetobacteraceae bacterium]